MDTDTDSVKVLLCDTADEVTRLQHALRTLDPAMEIHVTTESERVIEMAAGLQPDVIATELGLEGLKDVHLVRRLRDAAPLSAIVTVAPDRPAPTPPANALTAVAGTSALMVAFVTEN